MGLSIQEISILFSEWPAMRAGRIRTKERCPLCHGPFKELKRRMECPDHKVSPRRLFIDLWWDKEQRKIYSDQDGRVISSYEQGYLLLAQINKEISSGVFNPDNYIKKDLSKYWVMSLLDEFWKFKKPNIAPSWQPNYKGFIDAAKSFFKNKDVRKIRKMDLEEYKAYLKGKGISGKTLKNYLDNFRTFMNDCGRDRLEIIDAVPAMPKVDINDRPFLWLDRDDQIEIWNLIPAGDRPIFDFLALHGCRPSEARALRIQDLDLRSGMLTIRSTWSGKEFRERRKGKMAKPLTIPIHPEIMDFMAGRASEALPAAFVFVNPRTGCGYSHNRLRKIWDKIREKGGINRKLRLYDATRHSFGSQLGNSNVPMQRISKLMGHSSTKMTERYVHPDVAMMRVDLTKISLKKITQYPQTIPSGKNNKKW